MTRYDEPGKGRKYCKGCEKYVPVATKVCICGNSFEYGKVITEKQKIEKQKQIEQKVEYEQIEQKVEYESTNELDLLQCIPSVEESLTKLNIEIELNCKINSFQIALLKKQNKIKWSEKFEDEIKKTTRPVILIVNDNIEFEGIKNWFIEKKINVKSENFENIGNPINDPDLVIISFLKDYPKVKNISWKWKNDDETFLINLKKLHDYKISLLKKKIQKSTS